MRFGRFVLLLALSTGCTEIGPPEFTEGLTLGGVFIDAETLNHGRASYNRYCSSCHGLYGDGRGPVGYQQDPPARDFRHGIVKYAGVMAGSLPTDDDLRSIIRDGLVGTGMLPWRVPDDELDAVVHYIKTFSPRWREDTPGEPIELPKDPWLPDMDAAKVRGQIVYHTILRCPACHPAYLDRETIAELHPNGAPDWLRDDLHTGVTRESLFGHLTAPDFKVRALRTEGTPEMLYRSIAAGLGGTPMPTWQGAVSDEDLWAVVHYVCALLPPNSVK